ncbi:hypothetical protein [Megamonas funiformis]|uniref:hypothetical protein n=1 Tax=Megamonas funiformis TaxID=437897 RepID=UPI00265CE2DC|nr:hypothetical protein [Megamonas funiformis]
MNMQGFTQLNKIKINNNTFVINANETSNKVSNNISGIKIFRGTADDGDYNIVYDETDKEFKIGLDNSLKAVATKEYVDNQVDNVSIDGLDALTNVAKAFNDCIKIASQGEVIKADVSNSTIYSDVIFKTIRAVGDAESLKKSLESKPITMKEIFNDWIRFAHYDNTAAAVLDYTDCDTDIPNGQNLPDNNEYTDFTDKEKDGWTYDEATNTIKDNYNYRTAVGFISNDSSYSNYYIKLKINTYADDDHVFMVVGYLKDENGVEHTLSIVRAVGRGQGAGNSDTYYDTGYNDIDTRIWWALIYDICNPTQTIIADKSSITGPAPFAIWSSEWQAGGNSNSICYMSIERNYSTITFKTTQWSLKGDDQNFNSDYDIVFTIPSTKPDSWTDECYNNIKKMLSNAGHIGFGVRSNQADFTIVEQNNLFDNNKIYDLTSNRIYEYIDGAWTETTAIPDTEIPVQCFLYNQELGKLYFYFSSSNYIEIYNNNTNSAIGSNTLDYVKSISIANNSISIEKGNGTLEKFTINNVDHATNADNAVKSTKDGEGNIISSTYLKNTEVANTANKIPRYNDEGHLVLPSGIEIY